MIKPSRIDQVDKIVRLANLPRGKETVGYLTTRQLSDLVQYLEGSQETIRTLKGNMTKNDNNTET